MRSPRTATVWSMGLTSKGLISPRDPQEMLCQQHYDQQHPLRSLLCPSHVALPGGREAESPKGTTTTLSLDGVSSLQRPPSQPSHCWGPAGTWHEAEHVASWPPTDPLTGPGKGHLLSPSGSLAAEPEAWPRGPCPAPSPAPALHR